MFDKVIVQDFLKVSSSNYNRMRSRVLRKARFGSDDRIAELKALSGWCIDARRRREGIAQTMIAARAGVTARWLREIEGGDPRPTIDDHLRCAAAVGLSIGYIFIPMLCEEHGRTFPRELLLHDLAAMEQRCLDAVAGFSIADLLRDGDRG